MTPPDTTKAPRRLGAIVRPQQGYHLPDARGMDASPPFPPPSEPEVREPARVGFPTNHARVNWTRTVDIGG
jgi:hypothetical protein